MEPFRSSNWSNGAVFFSGMPDDDEFNDSSSVGTPRSNYSSPSKSNPGSTNGTPKKRGRQGENGSPVRTPAKVKNLEQILRTCDPQCDLTARESKELLEGVEALPTTRDSPHHSKRDSVAKRVATSSAKMLLNLGDDQELDLTDPKTHIALSDALEESSPWVGRVLQAASHAHVSSVYKAPEEMLRIFNWEHITSQQNGRGLHFLPRNHPDLQLLQHCTANSAGIYCGILHDKFSTFFPILDTEEELLEILNMAKPLCKFENRQLHITWGKDKKPFYVESFIQYGVKHHSAFPLFFFTQWQPGTSYEVIPGHAPLSSDLILQAAIRLGQEGIRYEYDNSCIIDIAQALPTAAQIQQGIYIEIPRQFLPDEE